ncbi:MAG: Holliday junction resolvase RuvX [Actinomycetota bacterium]|nr:Holliday junction resolvase RuvX [Actinomycetota bacterium]
MRKMGLDIGTKRIGVAISDPLYHTARALTVIERGKFDSEIQKLREIVAEYQIDEIIVGLPLKLNGTVGSQAKAVKEYIDKLGSTLPIPIRGWDERLTTLVAEKVLLSLDVKRAKRKRIVDKVAASVILQSYLDNLRQEEGE